MQSLTEIARILFHQPEANLNFLKVDVLERAIKFSNINKFKETLSVLSQVSAFEGEVYFLMASALYHTTADDLIVANSSAPHDIAIAAKFLQDSIIALKRLLPSILPEEPQECIYIRFPEAEDIALITNDLTTIEKATVQIVVNKDIDGSFKVIRWESGSLWIHVFVGTVAAVSIVAGAAWSAAVVAKKWMELKIFIEHAEGLSIKNDSLKDIKEGQKKLLDELVASEAKALAEKHFDIKTDPEIVERVRFTIATFSELIRRGGEVAPSLSAPEQVGNLFPNYKALLTIQSQIPQIKDTQ